MISIFKNIRETSKPFNLEVETALKRIAEGQSKGLIEKIRDEKDDKKRADLKAQLPCVMFSGVFAKRGIDGLMEHSGFVSLDFDHVEIPSDLFLDLLQDEYIYAAWISPSGDGIKALVKTEATNAENHYEYWEALHERYPDSDTACKDPSRVCYESFDDNLYLNKDPKTWTER
jgi:hypothetical protein